jgi:hypothetical protein
MNEEPDMAVVEKSMVALSSKLDAYDVILGKQKYLAGDVCFCSWGAITYQAKYLATGNDSCGPVPPSYWNSTGH